MKRTEEITDELEQELIKASKNPLLKMVAAPLRLMLVWMKKTNDRLNDLERDRNVEESS